jgi:hypothetical protein
MLTLALQRGFLVLGVFVGDLFSLGVGQLVTEENVGRRENNEIHSRMQETSSFLSYDTLDHLE